MYRHFVCGKSFVVVQVKSVNTSIQNEHNSILRQVPWGNLPVNYRVDGSRVILNSSAHTRGNVILL
jgi:hypothetical protein